MLNHTLIGSRVEWNNEPWRVTGARKPEPFAGRVEFRLLALRGSRKGQEVWTEPGPLLTDVEEADLQNTEVSGCLRAPMPEDAPRTAAGSPLDRPVGPVAGA